MVEERRYFRLAQLTGVPHPVEVDEALDPLNVGLLAKLIIFYAAFPYNALPTLKDDSLTRTMPTYKPSFTSTTSR
jgi:hypothetical protein